MIQKIIQAIEDELKKTWKDEPTGHDWEHIRRVRDMAIKIHTNEGGNKDIIEIGALLHDISDHKFNGGKLNAGGEKARAWLLELGAPTELAKSVSKLVDNISFKGANVLVEKLDLETQIVQDADRLDALGAIVIARAFAFGGNRSQPIHISGQKPILHDTFDSYVKSNTTTINHFYEKLLLLNQRINTETGKIIAEERHIFMELFLKQFYSEWNMNI